jgi:hypothetical protein
MEAVRINESSVYFNEITWRYIAEGYHLHTRRRKNFKSQVVKMFISQAKNSGVT